MGCDCHIVSQVKSLIDKPGWITISIQLLDRNYALFGLLAGVRGNDQFFEQKGLPNDFPLTKDHKTLFLSDDGYVVSNLHWIGDHSFTYLTLKELNNKKFLKKVANIEGTDDFLNLIQRYNVFSKQFKIKKEDIRFIFGFDS